MALRWQECLSIFLTTLVPDIIVLTSKVHWLQNHCKIKNQTCIGGFLISFIGSVSAILVLGWSNGDIHFELKRRLLTIPRIYEAWWHIVTFDFHFFSSIYFPFYISLPPGRNIFDKPHFYIPVYIHVILPLYTSLCYIFNHYNILSLTSFIILKFVNYGIAVDS